MGFPADGLPGYRSTGRIGPVASAIGRSGRPRIVDRALGPSPHILIMTEWSTGLSI